MNWLLALIASKVFVWNGIWSDTLQYYQFDTKKVPLVQRFVIFKSNWKKYIPALFSKWELSLTMFPTHLPPPSASSRMHKDAPPISVTAGVVKLKTFPRSLRPSTLINSPRKLPNWWELKIHQQKVWMKPGVTPPKFNIAPGKKVVGRLLSYWEG